MSSVEHSADARGQREDVADPVLRGWTGEFLQVRKLRDGDYRLWHADGAYFGRLVPDDDHTDDELSGTVYGPTGSYLANAAEGRLRVDMLRARAGAMAVGMREQELRSPGNLPPVDRRWPRREMPVKKQR